MVWYIVCLVLVTLLNIYIMTREQKLIHAALVDKLKRGGLKIQDQITICDVIKQIEVGTNLIVIPD